MTDYERFIELLVDFEIPFLEDGNHVQVQYKDVYVTYVFESGNYQGAFVN